MLDFRAAMAVLLVLVFTSLAWAGKYNPKLSIGDAAPDWEGLEGIDGELHALADLADKEVLVLCFTCQTCPYALDLEERLIALTKKLETQGKCAVVAVNPNLVKEDLLPAMRERAKAKGFNFLYLHDTPDQKLAKSYGATYTPEFVVLNKDRKVVYLGAFDDNPELKKPVSKHYVEEAVAAALAGKTPEVTETPAIGCLVRFAKERRKK